MRGRVLISGMIIFVVGCMTATIGPGNWTIKNPVRYQFPFRDAGGYRISSTITLGSNGAMLIAQIELKNPATPLPTGADLTTVTIAAGKDVRVLEAPDPGPLPTILNIPFAEWYLAPAGNSIDTITISIKGAIASWRFNEARRLNP
jgi:hypothetical protein